MTTKSNPGFKNGWTSQPFGTGQVALRNDHGVIRLQGGVAGGAATIIFTPPVGYCPAVLVQLTADGVNGAMARIDVGPGGNVFVSIPDNTLIATQFISLDGVSFSLGCGADGAPTANRPSPSSLGGRPTANDLDHLLWSMIQLVPAVQSIRPPPCSTVIV